MEELEAQLQEFYSPQGDTQRKREIEARLLAFRETPDAFQHARHFLEAASSPYLQWFAAMVLEDAVSPRKWHMLDPAVREQLRQFLLAYLTAAPPPSSNGSSSSTTTTTSSTAQQPRRLEPFVASKLQKVLVDMGKAGWPQEFPSFLTDILSLCQNPATYATGLALLALMGQEFVRDDLPFPSARKAELQAAFTQELPSVVQLLSSLLAHAHEPSSAPADVEIQRELACCALRCLSVLVEWPAMAPCLSPDLCANVFRVVQAAVRPGNDIMTPSGLAAVQVMTEVLNKKCVPRQLEEFVMNVAMQMCMVLESLVALTGTNTNTNTSTDNEVDEELLLALLEFLQVFLDQHLGRVLALPSFPFGEFGQLLAKFTFQQLPQARLLRRAFVPWATLLENLTETEAGLMALEKSQQLLSAVAAALLQKLLFVTNGGILEELEDEEMASSSGGGGGGGGGGGENNAAALLQSLLEEDEGDGKGTSREALAGSPLGFGFGGEMNEQQEVIAEGVLLLQSFARLPSCSQGLASQVLRALEEALQRLDQGMASAGSGGGGGGGRALTSTVKDCTTLLSLVLVVVPQAPAEPYWGALRLVLSTAQQMGQARLYAQGPVFLRMHCATLRALKDLTRGFQNVISAAASNPSSSSSSSSSSASLEGVIKELIAIVRAIFTLDTSIPEVIQLDAASLLLSLFQKLPAEQLRAYPIIQQLMQDAYTLVAPLSLPVQEKVLQAISLLLLPNTGTRCSSPEEEGNIAAAYIDFVSPLVGILKEAQSQITQGQTTAVLAPDSLLCLRHAAHILRSLCNLYAQTPKRIKSILFAGLIPGFGSLVPCLGTILPASASSSAAATTAQALLSLLMALHACFGKELGPSVMTEAVQLFVQLFASPGFLLGGGDDGGGGENVPASASSVFLLASLLRLLRQISADRTATPPGIVVHICQLVLDKLLPLVRAAPADLLPLLLRLIGSLLSDHWKDFKGSASTQTANGDRGAVGAGIAAGIAARALPFAGNIGSSSGGGGGGGGGGMNADQDAQPGKDKTFVSLEMQESFNRMLLILYETLQDTNLAPTTVRLAIELLQRLNRDVGLFRLEYFRSNMQLAYGLTLLNLLLVRAHPLLRDELLGLLRDITVGVDLGWTFQTLLPQALLQVKELNDDQRRQLLASVPSSRETMVDGPSFEKHMRAFLSDVTYVTTLVGGGGGGGL